jgi:hypothetical protein
MRHGAAGVRPLMVEQAPTLVGTRTPERRWFASLSDPAAASWARTLRPPGLPTRQRNLGSHFMLPAPQNQPHADALYQEAYRTVQAARDSPDAGSDQAETDDPLAALSNSCSSMRSLGPRMNTSHIMSGCCWFPLMKPMTGRPVAASITSVKRALMTS